MAQVKKGNDPSIPVSDLAENTVVNVVNPSTGNMEQTTIGDLLSAARTILILTDAATIEWAWNGRPAKVVLGASSRDLTITGLPSGKIVYGLLTVVHGVAGSVIGNLTNKATNFDWSTEVDEVTELGFKWDGTQLRWFSEPFGTIAGAGATPLTTPGSFAAATIDDDGIGLTWDDVANETNYEIQRSLDGSTGWTTINSPAAGATSYNNTGLEPETEYFYRIRAVGDGVTYSNSAWSSVVSDTTDAAGGGGYDADAQAFFDYVETTLSASLTTGEKDAVNDLVVDRKAAGLWTKDRAIYPRVGSTAAAMGVNLKNPGT
jgi:hypothetical protein